MNVQKMVRTVAILIGGFFVLTASAGFAQDGPKGPRGEGRPERPERQSPEQRIERQLQRLNEQLSLTKEQQAQVKTVLQNQSKEMKTIRDNAELEQGMKRTNYRKIMTETNNQIRALLTSEQQTEYDKLRTQMRQRMRQSRGGGRRGNPNNDDTSNDQEQE